MLCGVNCIKVLDVSCAALCAGCQPEAGNPHTAQHMKRGLEKFRDTPVA